MDLVSKLHIKFGLKSNEKGKKGSENELLFVILQRKHGKGANTMWQFIIIQDFFDRDKLQMLMRWCHFLFHKL